MIFARKKPLTVEQQENMTGYIFVIPYIIGFVIFQGLPLLLSFIISATNLKYISNLSKVNFIGINNFIELFRDERVINSFVKTLVYSCMYVPGIMIFSLFFAVLLNQKIFGKNFIRTAFFMPYVSNIVAISVVWSLILDPVDGPINVFLKAMGMSNPPMWLFSQKLVLPTIVIIAIWNGIGLQLVTYLAALQGVPRELYEASEMDGASIWQKFRHVTLPMVSPTTFFLLITSLIGSLQNFTIIQGLSRGGPGTASQVLSMNIIRDAFQSDRLGYATAQGMVMFVFIMAITLIQWRGQKKWVNYM